MAKEQQRIEQAYARAQEQYGELGVDVAQAIERLAAVPISLHCWQGDDVGGFERVADELGGGLAVTGNYPGKARTPDELRSDFRVGNVADSWPTPHQLARLLCGDRGQACGTQ